MLLGIAVPEQAHDRLLLGPYFAFGEITPSPPQLALSVPPQRFSDFIGAVNSLSHWTLGWVKIGATLGHGLPAHHEVLGRGDLFDADQPALRKETEPGANGYEFSWGTSQMAGGHKSPPKFDVRHFRPLIEIPTQMWLCLFWRVQPVPSRHPHAAYAHLPCAGSYD